MQKILSEISQINPLWIIPFTVYAIGVLILIYDLKVVKPVDDEQKEGEEFFKKSYVDDLLDKVLRGKTVPVILLAIFLSSCGTLKHSQNIYGLKQSGTYTVKTYKGSTATFKEFPGKYMVPSDTLKKGDKIFITVITKKHGTKDSENIVRH